LNRAHWGGIFFNRLSANLYANTLRFDGVTQQSIVIRNPLWPDPFAGDPVVEVRNTTQRTLDANLKAPYTINFTSSIEHQFPRGITFSLTHIYARGIHFYRSRQHQLALTLTGARPDPTQGNIYEVEINGNVEVQRIFVPLRPSLQPHAVNLHDLHALVDKQRRRQRADAARR